jgi:MinD superfamily P-loop ATPase
LTKEDITLITKLPYDEDFTKAMSKAKCIVENENSQLTTILKDSWKTIKDKI